MSFNYSPTIVTDGLVMYLDATNTKSLDDVPSRNLVTWSEDFTNGTWGKSNLTVSGNTTTSPIGTSTADSLIENSLLSQHAITKTVTVTSGNTFTYSIYLKPNSRFSSAVWVYDSSYTNGFGGNFNLTAGTVTTLSQGTGVNAGTNQITNVGDGWYRCKITGTIPTVTSFNIATYLLNNSGGSNYSGDGISNLFLWGAQLEIGPVATTYIPTTTVAVSRTPTWVDLSRGGNNGTLTNGPTYDYSNGGGIVLTNALNATGSSVTQRVSIPNSSSIQFTTGMSADIWFYANGSTQPSIFPRLLEKGDFYVLILQTLPSNLSFNVSSVAGNRTVHTSNSPITNTTRINVTTTYDGQLSKIYINGILNNTTDWGSVSLISPSISGLKIGDNGENRPINGTIYSTKLYNRALSAAEVLQNYNTTKSRFGL